MLSSEEMVLELVLFFDRKCIQEEFFFFWRMPFSSAFDHCVLIPSPLLYPVTYCHHQTEHSTKPSGLKNQKLKALLGEMNFHLHP